jgi:hypothetical protein
VIEPSTSSSSSTDLELRGEAFTASAPGGRVGGMLRLGSRVLRFESEHFAADLPLDGIECRFGGFNDGTLFLRHPARPEVTLIAREVDPVFEQLVALVPQAAAARVQAKRRDTRFWTAVGTAGGMFLVLLGGAVLVAFLVVRWVLHLLDPWI